jgi:hypothetical protein
LGTLLDGARVTRVAAADKRGQRLVTFSKNLHFHRNPPKILGPQIVADPEDPTHPEVGADVARE